MPPRHKVDKLPDDQLQFVIDRILNGDTDREISISFEDEFKTRLSKSSLSRWRNSAAADNLDRYKFTRFLARKVVEDLGKQPDADKHALLVENIEDHLLNAAREVNKTDAHKLMLIQQEERRRKLRERELDLKERAQTFAEEQARKSEQLEKDRFAIGADTWRFILAFMKEKDPTAVDALLKHNEALLEGLETYLENAA